MFAFNVTFISIVKILNAFERVPTDNQLGAFAPEVVLLDWQLPDRTVLELLSDIHAFTGVDRIKVVVLTATLTPERESEARAGGAVEVWAKPIFAHTLRDGLSRLGFPGKGQ